MASIRSILDCMFSPRLIKVYKNGPVRQRYRRNTLELWGDKVISSLYVIWKFSVYTSPFLVGILYRKDYFAEENLVTLSKFVTSIGVILVVSFCLRGLGRAQNATYKNFIAVLNEARVDLTPTIKKKLANYEFEFYAWPIEYSWNNVSWEAKHSRVSITKPVPQCTTFQFVLSLPRKIMSYVAAHTLAIRLIYPGSVGVLKMVLASTLAHGREKLIETHRGARYKLSTKENNIIDTMFIEKRTLTPKGDTLVICCEGNAGYYEIGIMGSAIEAGYSVLGWNHPGFGASTGRPYPEQEQNAIDIVMQFAINKLDFRPEQIILFAWSIGGYAATWAAMNYPNVKGIILDATFDDLLPLAICQTPVSLEWLVEPLIRDYINLHNFEQLVKYAGPILLIRRTEDEVICLSEGDVSSNRGNNLLMKILRFRYPVIMGQEQVHLLNNYLAVSSPDQDLIIAQHGGDETWCSRVFESYILDNNKEYPMKIGENLSMTEKSYIALFLAGKYMKDIKSSHCSALPGSLLQPPWDINVENGFVFT